MAEVESEPVQQRPPMPCKLLQAAIEGEDQVLTEMLGLEKEDGGHTSVTIESLAENEHYNNHHLQSAKFMGNTVLHVLCAYNHALLASKVCKKDGSLLRAQNKLLETPLHYAAKGIVSEEAMVALIEFARSEGELILKGVLRDRNCHGETALHVVAAYYRRNKECGDWNTHKTIVQIMMDEDSEWADQVDNNGLSSRDVGIARGHHYMRYCMVHQLHNERTLSRISCSGINQPTASSAEIAQKQKEMPTSVGIAQKWKEMPTSIGIFRSPPIHTAASRGDTHIVELMLEKDASLAYLQDSDGLFPVHVAASRGHVKTVRFFMQNYLDSGELVDHHERNFLHIAAEENMSYNFSKILLNSYKDNNLPPFWDNILERMIRTTDKEGNTPMHIASEKGNKSLMKILYEWESTPSGRRIHNIRNRKGQSAFDISVIEVKTRMKNSQEIEESIQRYQENIFSEICEAWFDNVMSIAEGNNSSMMDQLQIIGLGAVLITTVAFAAAFTLPGGYDSNGSPLLAGKYLFRAFILAITSAFLQSFLCVLMLMIGGLSSLDFSGKSVFLSVAMYLFSGGARSMVLSFGLGLYLVLSPVNKGISILILLLAVASVMLDITPNVLQAIIKVINHLGSEKELWKRNAKKFPRFMIFLRMLRFILPFVFIFIFALLR